MRGGGLIAITLLVTIAALGVEPVVSQPREAEGWIHSHQVKMAELERHIEYVTSNELERQLIRELAKRDAMIRNEWPGGCHFDHDAAKAKLAALEREQARLQRRIEALEFAARGRCGGRTRCAAR